MESLKFSQQAKPLKTGRFQALGLNKFSDFSFWLKRKHFNLKRFCNTSLEVRSWNVLHLLLWGYWPNPPHGQTFSRRLLLVTSQNLLQHPSNPVGHPWARDLARNTSAHCYMREAARTNKDKFPRCTRGGISKQNFSDSSWKILKLGLSFDDYHFGWKIYLPFFSQLANIFSMLFFIFINIPPFFNFQIPEQLLHIFTIWICILQFKLLSI